MSCALPFLPSSIPRVSEAFGKRVVVDFQLRNLPKKHILT